jgi:hypothetical protein
MVRDIVEITDFKQDAVDWGLGIARLGNVL